MKIWVSPTQALSTPLCAWAALSTARVAVVPTAMTLFPRALVSRINSTVCAGTSHHSLCMT